MKNYEVSWRDEVHKKVVIRAASEEAAYQMWEDGLYECEETQETDCQGLSDKDEVMGDMKDI